MSLADRNIILDITLDGVVTTSAGAQVPVGLFDAGAESVALAGTSKIGWCRGAPDGSVDATYKLLVADGNSGTLKSISYAGSTNGAAATAIVAAIAADLTTSTLIASQAVTVGGTDYVSFRSKRAGKFLHIAPSSGTVLLPTAADADGGSFTYTVTSPTGTTAYSFVFRPDSATAVTISVTSSGTAATDAGSFRTAINASSDLAALGITASGSGADVVIAFTGYACVLSAGAKLVLSYPTMTGVGSGVFVIRKRYASSAEVTTSQTAGEISTNMKSLLAGMFEQPKIPPYVDAVLFDAATLASYWPDATKPSSLPSEGIIDALKACSTDWWCLVSGIKTTNYNMALSEAAELGNGASGAKRLFFVFQTADLSVGSTEAFAAGSLADLADRERTAVLFHDKASRGNVFRWVANRLAFDPKKASVAWHCKLAGGELLARNYPASFFNALYANDGTASNNINFAVPYLRSDTVPYVDPGYNCAGRPIYQILSMDQFAERLQDAIANERLALSLRGEKWPVSDEGGARLVKVIEGLYQSMVGSKHFRDDPAKVIAYETISTEDTNLGRLRARVLGFFEVDGRQFSIDIYLRSSALTE